MQNSTDKEDYPLSEVPKNKRRGFFSILAVLLGFTFFSATMWAGGAVGHSFRLWPDLIAVIIAGDLILAGYVAVLAAISSSSGLNTLLMARFCFGRAGSRWPELLLAATQIGWYAWGTATIAITLIRITGTGDSWTVPFMVFFGFLFCWSAFVGYRGLEILSILSVPLMIVLMCVSLSAAVSDAGGISGMLAINPSNTMGWGQALTIVVGTFISGGTQATNWTRFSCTKKEAVLAALIAFFTGNSLMLIFGAAGALVYNQPDIVEVLVIQGLLLPGIVMLFANIWTTQDNTIYNFSIAGCSLLRTQKRRLVTLCGAGIGTAIGVLGIYDWIIPYMEWLGLLIPPLAGVIMADFYIAKKGTYPLFSTASISDYNIPGILAYLTGCAFALKSPGIPPLNGIFFAFVTYALLTALKNKYSKKQKNG